MLKMKFIFLLLVILNSYASSYCTVFDKQKQKKIKILKFLLSEDRLKSLHISTGVDTFSNCFCHQFYLFSHTFASVQSKAALGPVRFNYLHRLKSLYMSKITFLIVFVICFLRFFCFHSRTPLPPYNRRPRSDQYVLIYKYLTVCPKSNFI